MAPPRRLHEVKALTDTAKPERQAPSLPRSADGTATPEPPDWFDEYGQAKWRELVPALADRRLLTGGPLSLLELLCATYSRFRQANVVIASSGTSYEAMSSAGARALRGKQAEGAEAPEPAAVAVLQKQRPEAAHAASASKEYAVYLREYNRLLEMPATGSGADEFTQLLEANSGRRNSHR